MSDYGAMILMENGNPFVTPNSTPFCLYRKVSANSVQNGTYHQATINVAIDSSYPVMVFCKTTVTQGGTYVSAGRSGNTVTAGSSNYLSQAHTLTAYIFAIFPQSLPAWGIAFWDAAGKLVLTNESRVLSDLVTVGTPGSNGGLNIDVTWLAVMQLHLPLLAVHYCRITTLSLHRSYSYRRIRRVVSAGAQRE